MANDPSAADKIRENFQKATAATARAISHRPDADISYGVMPSYDGRNKIRLTNYIKGEMRDYFHALRGESDSAAGRMRYHDAKLHRQFSPQQYEAREFFDAFEFIRAEMMAAMQYKGVKANLQNRYDTQSSQKSLPEHLPLHRALQMLAWNTLNKGGDIPESIAQLIHESMPQILQKNRVALQNSISDQPAYAKILRQILSQLGIEEQDQTETDENESAEGQNEQPDDDSSKKQTQSEDPSPHSGEQTPQPADTKPEPVSGDGDAQPQEADTPARSNNTLPLSRYWETEGQFSYKSFTAEFDEIVGAEQLCTAQELANLRAGMDQYLSYLPPIVTRLANKLQRKLQAQQKRGWHYDQEEGLLDPSRLTRLIYNPKTRNYHMREKQTDFNDTVVTLLLDNSGSMRGRPIILAALSADILARTLERCGVKVEILGFTTKSWKGGQPFEKWVGAGKPPQPGRLNDLRHIIYKSADASYRRTRQNLGVMLKEGLLKENIDGEALLWAHRRLIGRAEQRKILMVISDGAPVDDLTTSANGGIYLEQHLRGVIQWIESKSPVELVAIGIGHDVTRYYENAVTIADVEQLGPVMLGQLDKLFE